jgi:hypothetical protein
MIAKLTFGGRKRCVWVVWRFFRLTSYLHNHVFFYKIILVFCFVSLKNDDVHRVEAILWSLDLH